MSSLGQVPGYVLSLHAVHMFTACLWLDKHDEVFNLCARRLLWLFEMLANAEGTQEWPAEGDSRRKVRHIVNSSGGSLR